MRDGVVDLLSLPAQSTSLVARLSLPTQLQLQCFESVSLLNKLLEGEATMVQNCKKEKNKEKKKSKNKNKTCKIRRQMRVRNLKVYFLIRLPAYQ